MAKKGVAIKKTNNPPPKRIIKNITINMGARIYSLLKSLNKKAQALLKKDEANKKHFKEIKKRQTALKKEIAQLKKQLLKDKK